MPTRSPAAPLALATTTAPIDEIAVLWLTAGLSCDGDTIAMTAATQPSIEELLTGAIPWTPRVKLYNPFLAFENGDEFVRYYHRAAAGDLEPPRTMRRGSPGAERRSARSRPAPCAIWRRR
jgi:hydrogenase small subunit